jgi:hypothetical protein
MEITVTELNPSDEIKIRTRCSDYSFRLIDPLQCRGVLSGGPLSGGQQAVFGGTIVPASLQPNGSSQLEPGGRAVFFVGNLGLNTLTTSIITEISLYEVTEITADEC